MTETVENVDRKEQILEAAITIFARHGFSESTVSQVASEADVSKGTIYLYFDSKPDILYEIFTAFETNLYEIIDRVLNEPTVSETTLREHVQALAGFAESNPDTVKVLFDFWSNSLRDGRSGPIDFQSIYGRIRQKVKDLLEKGTNQGVFDNARARELPSVLVGLFEGLLIHWLADPDSPDLQTLSELTTDVVLEGIGS